MNSDEPPNKIIKNNGTQNNAEAAEAAEAEEVKRIIFTPSELMYLVKNKNLNNILNYLKNIELIKNEYVILGIIIKDTFAYSFDQILPIIDLLHKNKLNLNFMNSVGSTPLKCAIVNKNMSLLKALIHYKVDLEISYPLQISIIHNFVEAFDILIQAGANPNAQDPDGNTPIMLAAFYGNITFFEKLIKIEPLVNLDHINKKKRNVLMMACDNSNNTNNHIISKCSIVNTLIEKGVKINEIDVLERTALSINCNFINEFTNLIIITLLDAGADPNIPDINGNTSLLHLAGNNFEDYTYQIVSSMITLINHGANKNHKNKQNDTIYNLMIDEIKQWFDICSVYTKNNINQKIFINRLCLICTEPENKMIYFDSCQHIVICFKCFQSLQEHNSTLQTSRITKCPLCNTQIADYRVVEYMNDN
jgi:ankyrin repeat protein